MQAESYLGAIAVEFARGSLPVHTNAVSDPNARERWGDAHALALPRYHVSQSQHLGLDTIVDSERSELVPACRQ